MSTSTTTNLGLVLDNADEPVKTHHRHANENLATLDVTIKSLQDSMANAKALLGQLGMDAEEHYVVDAETARTTLGVPSSSDIADIVRQNIPLMSPTIRGGAKLEEHGGLALRDGALGIGSLVQESDGAVRGSIAGLTAEGHAEQMSTTGKNLFDESIANTQYYVNSDGTFTNGITDTRPQANIQIQVYNGNTLVKYALISGTYPNRTIGTITIDSDVTRLRIKHNGQSRDLPIDVPWTVLGTFTISCLIPSSDPTTVGGLVIKDIQVEEGSTATEYEPYTGGLPSPRPDWEQPIEVVSGHEVTGKTGRFVDLEVRDANDQLLSTTPIPLPRRGWVAGLPDGTADVLTLDGAGKVTWELVDAETTTAATDGITGTVGVDVLSTTGQIADGATVLYKLATPVTEDCSYVDMPAIPSDATVTIPELDALGVKYFVDDSAGTLARQWYDREVNESDESLAQSIAMIESTTAKSNHAVNSYFMLDNVLRKATSAIASGETISNSNSSPITVEQVITTLNNSVAALEKEVVFATTPSVSHRNIYRGKNLGTVLTTAQKAQIAAGTFDDLYVGDYWPINGRVYRIADIDYYYNTGDTAFTKHHLVIVPDASFGNSVMNDTNITTGAYVGSKMYTSSDSMLNAARNTISNDFGSYLASHKEYLPNAVDSSGAQSAGAWYSSTVELMNEPMVYGCFIHAKPTSGVGHLYTIDKAQLALFRLNPAMVNLRYNYWLRDVVSSTTFAYVNSGGYAGNDYASGTGVGVRPYFCIVGD